jgi:protein-S-isoprenylcysteine O-methyltransferase Ste14
VKQHLDDILVALGVCVVAYGVSWWSIPAAIVLLGLAILAAGLLIGSTARR